MTIHLHRGDADSWAINVPGGLAENFRAVKGVSHQFQKVWSLELQSAEPPELEKVDWDAVLERAIYAYDMNDPLISDFAWPLKTLKQERPLA